MAGDGRGRRWADGGVSSLGALFAAGLEELGRHRAGQGSRERLGRGGAGVPQHGARRNLDRDRRRTGLAAAGRAPRRLACGDGSRRRVVPDGRCRRPEGPDRDRRLGLGPRPRELAGRSRCDRGRARASRGVGGADRSAGPQLAACRRRRIEACPPCHRHGLRNGRCLWLGAFGRLRAGRPGQGARRLQPVEPGLGTDLRGRHRGREAAAPRRAAVDRGGLDLQGRDLSLPAVAAADARGTGGRRRIRPRHGPSARLG